MFFVISLQFGQHLGPNVTLPPVLEFIAKNVAARRSHGEFLLPKAIDTVLTSNWWTYFDSGEIHHLERKYGPFVFRLARVDTEDMPPPGTVSVAELENYLLKKAYVVYGPKR